MDDEDKKQTFTTLQSKDAKLPFLYTDSVDKYLSALRRERKDGVPCNVLVSPCAAGETKYCNPRCACVPRVNDLCD